MTISNIEVSSFPSESALSKYAIKQATIIFEKHRILAWRVTFAKLCMCYESVPSFIKRLPIS